MPLGLWLRFVAEADPEGMLPCDVGERYRPRTQAEQQQADAALQQLADAQRPPTAAAASARAEL